MVGCAYAKRACWALSCCCSLLLLPQPHTHTSVWWWWRRLRWQWDRLRWGVVRWGSSVCRCVWGVHRGYNNNMYYYYYYYYTPQYTPHTNEQTDDPPVGIEREIALVCVCACVCLLYLDIIDTCTHTHTNATHTGGQHAVVVHPVHRSPARTRTCVYYIICIWGSHHTSRWFLLLLLPSPPSGIDDAPSTCLRILLRACVLFYNTQI